jgi:hypothetical protein
LWDHVFHPVCLRVFGFPFFCHFCKPIIHPAYAISLCSFSDSVSRHPESRRCCGCLRLPAAQSAHFSCRRVGYLRSCFKSKINRK